MHMQMKITIKKSRFRIPLPKQTQTVIAPKKGKGKKYNRAKEKRLVCGCSPFSLCDCFSNSPEYYDE